MSIRPVRELPKPKRVLRQRESYVAKDVREFIRLGYEVACVEVEGRTDKRVAAALKNYVEHHPDQCAGIAVRQRDGKAYLVREVVR